MSEKLKPLNTMSYNSDPRLLCSDDIIGFGQIGDWIPSEDRMSGCLNYVKAGDYPNVVYATPHWNEDGEVPVDISYENGDYENLTTIHLDMDESIEYQLNQYIAVISVILSKLK